MTKLPCPAFSFLVSFVLGVAPVLGPVLDLGPVLPLGPVLLFVHPKALRRAVDATRGLAPGAGPNAFSIFAKLESADLLSTAGAEMLASAATSWRGEIERARACSCGGPLRSGDKETLIRRVAGYGEGREFVRVRRARNS